MTIIAARSNVNPAYENALNELVEDARVRREANELVSAIGWYSAIMSSMEKEPHPKFRMLFRAWVGLYDITDPRQKLDISTCDKLKAHLAKEGYRFNPSWKKAENPLTSILIKEEDLRF